MKPKVDILIKNIDRKQWYAFLAYCKLTGTTGTKTIRDIIAKHIKEQGKI